jgi:hypothetical protein
MSLKSSASTKDEMSMQLNKGFASQLPLNINMCVQLFDENGKLLDERFVQNTVTTAGKAGVADQILASPTLAKMGWMAVGTGSPGATLLGAEIARVAFDTKTRSGAVVTVVATFPAGTGTGALTEAGTFDVVTANTVNMWMSASYGTVTKGASDSVVITWTLTVS